MAMLVSLTWVGKTHPALDSLKREYLNHFEFIIILFPTLKHNEMYRQWKWLWTVPYVIPIESGNCLYDWIKKLGAGHKTLFLIDNIIANKSLDK